MLGYRGTAVGGLWVALSQVNSVAFMALQFIQKSIRPIINKTSFHIRLDQIVMHVVIFHTLPTIKLGPSTPYYSLVYRVHSIHQINAHHLNNNPTRAYYDVYEKIRPKALH